jgi:riboflavin synthase
MFTGIITDVGQIRAAEQRDDLRLTIGCSYDMNTVDLGASIACSGVCLTVVDKGADWFAVDVSAETKLRSATFLWQERNRLNLERSLRLGDELGGHIVTGHIDDVVELVEVKPVGGSLKLTYASHVQLAPFLAPKGSVTLDGVSLTVNEVWDGPNGDGIRFSVNIIPHTAAQTTFSDADEGRWFNIEIDVLARYIGRMMELRR